MSASVSTAGLRRGPAVLALTALLVVGIDAPARHAVTAAPAVVIEIGARGIRAIQQRLRSVPTDPHAWAALGSEYVQEARLSGGPTSYPKADRALRKSLAL